MFISNLFFQLKGQKSLNQRIGKMERKVLKYLIKICFKIKSLASINPFRSGIDRAHKFNHVRKNCRFIASWMSTIDNNPRDISVSRVEFFSCNCHFILPLISLRSSGTAMNFVPVKIKLGWAFLARSGPIRRITFKTDNEGKCLSIEVIESNSTSFNHISFTFSRPMLARKDPAWSTLSSFSISIRIEIEITNFPEILHY